MKRVLFVIDSFPNYSETFLYNQIYFLLDHGIEVDVIAIKKKAYSQNVLHKKMIEYSLSERVRFLRHGIDPRLLINLLIYPVLSIKMILNCGLKKAFYLIQNFDLFNRFKNFNVVHAHYGHIGALVGDLRKVGVFKNQRLICSFHGEELLPIHLDSYQTRYSNMLEFFDVITANSYYTKELIIKSLNPESKRLIVFPVFVDKIYFEDKKIKIKNADSFNLIFVGRLIELKAPLLAVQIVEKLLKLNYIVRLDIVGSGPEFDRCFNYIEENKLDTYIKLHGALSQEEIKELYKESDVFLFPGIKEPATQKAESNGLVIQEAQAMRIPVIVSDVGGMKYGLIDGKTGYVVPENDINGFVEKVEYLIQNPNLKAELGENGKRFVSENFDSIVLGKKLLQIYGMN